MKKLSPGMEALQLKVAKKINDERKRSIKPKTAVLLLKMHEDFKLTLTRHAMMEGRSMTNYILTAVADRMQWDGTI